MDHVAAQECATNSSSGSQAPIVPSRGTHSASSQLSSGLICKLVTQVITIAVILCKYSLHWIWTKFIVLTRMCKNWLLLHTLTWPIHRRKHNIRCTGAQFKFLRKSVGSLTRSSRWLSMPLPLATPVHQINIETTPTHARHSQQGSNCTSAICAAQQDCW